MKGLIGTMTVICMGMFLLGGCTQGILITRVCEDLVYATATLPDSTRQDIYKYSCVENKRHALGKTLETLQPSQMEEIVKKLSEKGYNVQTDRILSRGGEILSIILSGVIFAALIMMGSI